SDASLEDTIRALEAQQVSVKVIGSYPAPAWVEEQ
ncbi:MAG: hypothetical protein RLZZ476_1772, partial [Verrucomicrobiota bacterium]